jgi:hypothetical protein
LDLPFCDLFPSVRNLCNCRNEINQDYAYIYMVLMLKA